MRCTCRSDDRRRRRPATPTRRSRSARCKRGTAHRSMARTIPYTATAGTLTIRDVAGKPKASIFYTAYTADGAPSSQRPIMFFYNGGPGSASLWLRMGSFGPMRCRPAIRRPSGPRRSASAPIPDTLLGVDRHGVHRRAGHRLFASARRRQGQRILRRRPGRRRVRPRRSSATSRKFGRWDSPKFLFGESYGTTRSGALAYQLQDRGMALNGVVLLSSIMNYGRRQPGLDRDYLNYFRAMPRPPGIITRWPIRRPRSIRRRREAALSLRGPTRSRWRRARRSAAGRAPCRRAADERADRLVAAVHRAMPICASTCRAFARS